MRLRTNIASYLLMPVLALGAIAFTTPAFAYSLVSEPNTKGCDGDGSGCIVYCKNGDRAGEMYWNGSVWSDGVRWNSSKDVEAASIVAANGQSCE